MRSPTVPSVQAERSQPFVFSADEFCLSGGAVVDHLVLIVRQKKLVAVFRVLAGVIGGYRASTPGPLSPKLLPGF